MTYRCLQVISFDPRWAVNTVIIPILLGNWGLEIQQLAQGNTAAAKSLQSCPTLCDPIDRSPPGSPVPGILQQEHWSGLPLPSPLVAATSMLIKESLLLFLGLLISPSCEEQLQLFSENQENGNC